MKQLLYAGIDWATKTHAVGVVDDHGESWMRGHVVETAMARVRLRDSVSSGDCAAVMAYAAAPVLACPWRMSRTLLRFGDGH